MTTNITTGLSVLSQKVGKLIKPLTDFASDKFSVIAVSVNWVITRDNSKLRIIAANGTKRDYNNTYSDAFETNVIIASNKALIISTEAQYKFATVVNLTDGNILKKIYIVGDPAPASLVLDEINNRVIIFKAAPKEGLSGTAWIYAIDLATYTSTQLYNETNNPSLNSKFIHLDITSTGDIYRSYKNTGISEISKITANSTTGLNASLYTDSPPRTVISNNAGSDIKFPKFINNKVFVLSEDCQSFSAWDTSTLNNQIISPIIIDTRAGLLGALSTVQYPRFQYDLSTGYYHDTRTFFTWDTQNDSVVTNEYSICIDNEETTAGAINLQDTQPVRVFSQFNKAAYYRANSKHFIFELQKDLSCEITKSVEQASQQFQMKSYSKLFRADITKLTGSLEYSLDLPQKSVFINENFVITSSGTIITVNGNTHSLDGGNLFNLCKIDYGLNSSISNRYIVRTTNRFLVFDENGDEILNESPNSSLITQYYSFIYNDKFYVFHSNGIVSLDLINFTRQNTVGFWSGNPLNSKLFINPFTKEINLFNRDTPNILRKFNYEPLFIDYTNTSIINDYSSIITSALPSSVPKSSVSQYWSITWIDPQRLLYIDYSNNLYEIIESLIETTEFGVISTNQVSIFEPSPTITVMGDLIFDRNIREILKVRGGKIPRSSIKLESSNLLDTSDLAVYSGDYELKALVNNEVYNFFSRAETQIIEPFTLNKLRFTLFDADFGNLLETVELSNCNVQSYEILPEIKNIDIEVFNEGSKVSSTDSNEILFNFDLSLVVNTDELRVLLLIYYSQIKQSSETGLIEIKFADTLIEQQAYNGHRENLFDVGNYFQYSVLFEDLQWSWFSEEKYQIQLKIKEVSKNNV